MASQPAGKLTLEQYLEIERAAEFRSEFIDGQVIARAGGALPHAILQSNIQFELGARLQGTGCRAFGPDFRIQVSRRFATYPDVAVVCGRVALAEGQNEQYPDAARLPEARR